MAGYRPPYTLSEDKKIIRFIIDGNYGRAVRGDRLWKLMEEEEVADDRTWHSLKNRWVKNIVKDLGRPEYGLTMEEKNTLKEEMGLHNLQVWPEDSKLKKKKKLPLEEVKKEEEEEVDKESPSTAETVKDESPSPSTPSTEKNESPRTPKTAEHDYPDVLKNGIPKREDQFYSLDMQWSDDDTE